ncbi:hypothetical protein ACFSL4_19585 [Streptomyces caeni]|uniref:Secreted protein n=1 Tax=Streptomyces caeni TaxID=2307231 RepID=A0ABW4ITU6_9ACTN
MSHRVGRWTALLDGPTGIGPAQNGKHGDGRGSVSVSLSLSLSLSLSASGIGVCPSACAGACTVSCTVAAGAGVAPPTAAGQLSVPTRLRRLGRPVRIRATAGDVVEVRPGTDLPGRTVCAECALQAWTSRALVRK